MIKNVIFDLGEVLFTGLRDTGSALMEKHELDLTSIHPVAWTAQRNPLLTPLVEEFFHGNVSEDEYINDILATYPQLGSAQELKQHIRDNFREVAGTREIVLELKQLGYTLAILSVHAKEWIEHCEKKYDFHKLFDVHAYSYESKVSKPHPASFQSVLKKLNTSPEQCIFIDDSKINIKAASNLGIHGILFTTAPALRTELEQLLPDFK